ncbi:PP2C family protein-serine/threonine phosphatase [Streptomyces sp. NPDC088354]|uniref:PP2C family protein-serine/threonine phosphatase n=1 Tax=unclassified Streptomyces TaxID=2593676 RepID=UPI0029B27539|nr:SpoIIE family protein phosphatase [Streptomyces sp. MI02-7b]MDX3071191.1 SpoIIE family protein phosphatase [Streptomyces sp. MI02-7b]
MGLSGTGDGRRTAPAADIDYAALFAATPSPCLVLDPRFMIVGVNQAYLEATGRTRDDLLGQYLFDAFPDNPADPHADGVRNLSASLERVLAFRTSDTMAPQKYDIPVVSRPGAFEERWWSPINTPVLAPDGTVSWIIHRVEDVTAFVQARRHRHVPKGGRLSAREQVMEAELYVRARELQVLNEELRRAHARERQVALTLQDAMLHSPDLAQHGDVAVRYLPAAGSLNVCGDWYDVVDLPDDRFAVAVGDVVGHGLQAASVMGMLRSALSAATRTAPGPARALEILGQYARSVEGALATTAVSVLIMRKSREITYSSAGHPPPVLLRTDGRCVLLDEATDPPLGAGPCQAARPQARVPYVPGDALVLYTDGLIERRGEDIDVGLTRLTDALTAEARLGAEPLADAVLDRLGLSRGGADDIALVTVRL